MKNYIFNFFAVLLLFFGGTMVSEAKCAISTTEDDAPVKVLAYFSKGDTAIYRETRTKTRNMDGTPKTGGYTADYQLVVKEATNEGYLIECTFLDFDFNLTNGPKPTAREAEMLDSFKKSWMSMRVVFRTDAYGEVVKIVNWEELGNELNTIMGNMLPQSQDKSLPSLNQMMNGIGQAFGLGGSEEFFINEFPPIGMLFPLHGQAFAEGEQVVMDEDNAHVTVTAQYQNAKDGAEGYKISARQEATMNLLETGLGLMSSVMGDPMTADDLMKGVSEAELADMRNLNMNIDKVVNIEYTLSGWPKYSENSSIASVEGDAQTEGGQKLKNSGQTQQVVLQMLDLRSPQIEQSFEGWWESTPDEDGAYWELNFDEDGLGTLILKIHDDNFHELEELGLTIGGDMSISFPIKWRKENNRIVMEKTGEPNFRFKYPITGEGGVPVMDVEDLMKEEMKAVEDVMKQTILTQISEIFPNGHQVAIINKLTDDELLLTIDGEEEHFKKSDKGKIYNVVEQAVAFPGGEAAIMDYITEHVKCPKEAKKHNIGGTAVVSFIVNEDGSVGKAYVANSLEPDTDKQKNAKAKLQKKNGEEYDRIVKACEAEAVRVIKSLPRFIPAKIQGKAAKALLHIPVRF